MYYIVYYIVQVLLILHCTWYIVKAITEYATICPSTWMSHYREPSALFLSSLVILVYFVNKTLGFRNFDIAKIADEAVAGTAGIHVAWKSTDREQLSSRLQCKNLLNRREHVHWDKSPVTAPTNKSFPKPWHATSQEALFVHLRSLWPDDCCRVFVDLGSLPLNGIITAIGSCISKIRSAT